MKLYGSVVNRLEEHVLSPVPAVGMGATLYMWSDRLAGTVVKVSESGKTVTVQEDTYACGFPDGYAKDYTPNPNGRLFVARRRKNGTWASAGMGVTFGARKAYRDPSF